MPSPERLIPDLSQLTQHAAEIKALLADLKLHAGEYVVQLGAVIGLVAGPLAGLTFFFLSLIRGRRSPPDEAP